VGMSAFVLTTERDKSSFLVPVDFLMKLQDKPSRFVRRRA
jgi:hypothetical protein